VKQDARDSARDIPRHKEAIVDAPQALLVNERG
jgi:hypothetical protein